MKKINSFMITIFIFLIGLSIGLIFILLQLQRIKPQLKEELISVQTVKLDGEIYACGTVVENRDKDSLYCRGFTDGKSWAIGQVRIDKQLQEGK